jgi:hypothetical protein
MKRNGRPNRPPPRQRPAAGAGRCEQGRGRLTRPRGPGVAGAQRGCKRQRGKLLRHLWRAGAVSVHVSAQSAHTPQGGPPFPRISNPIARSAAVAVGLARAAECRDGFPPLHFGLPPAPQRWGLARIVTFFHIFLSARGANFNVVVRRGRRSQARSGRGSTFPGIGALAETGRQSGPRERQHKPSVSPCVSGPDLAPAGRRSAAGRPWFSGKATLTGLLEGRLPFGPRGKPRGARTRSLPPFLWRLVLLTYS